MKLSSLSEILAWSDPSQDTTLTLDEAVHAFHNMGSRSVFFRTLPLGASVLDAGAGDGGSEVYRHWPEPARPDLKMYAWAGDMGARFDQFDGYEVGFWPQNPPDFGGQKFDAIFSANFLEHIPEPLRFVEWATGRLAPGGSIYLEWPQEASYTLPTNVELQANGIPVMTGRYDDDPTHQPTIPDVDAVMAALRAAGLDIVRSGTVETPFADRELAIHARRTSDIVGMTMAYWSVTAWCRYLVARRGR